MHPLLGLLFVLLVAGSLGLQGYVLLRSRQFKLVFVQTAVGVVAVTGGLLKFGHVPLPSIAEVLVALMRHLGGNV